MTDKEVSILNDKPWEWIKRVGKLKQKMIEKKLWSAKATCLPPCKGFIVASRAKSNNHVHARCTECKRIMME